MSVAMIQPDPMRSSSPLGDRRAEGDWEAPAQSYTSTVPSSSIQARGNRDDHHVLGEPTRARVNARAVLRARTNHRPRGSAPGGIATSTGRSGGSGGAKWSMQ